MTAMQQTCQKCGAEIKPEQAFCSKCGAVVGMGDAGEPKGDEWDMASTFVVKKPGGTGERSRPNCLTGAPRKE